MTYFLLLILTFTYPFIHLSSKRTTNITITTPPERKKGTILLFEVFQSRVLPSIQVVTNFTHFTEKSTDFIKMNGPLLFIQVLLLLISFLFLFRFVRSYFSFTLFGFFFRIVRIYLSSIIIHSTIVKYPFI